MAFSFGFGNDDDQADAQPQSVTPSVNHAQHAGDSGDSRPVQEHALQDLVGKGQLPYYCTGITGTDVRTRMGYVAY